MKSYLVRHQLCTRLVGKFTQTDILLCSISSSRECKWDRCTLYSNKKKVGNKSMFLPPSSLPLHKNIMWKLAKERNKILRIENKSTVHVVAQLEYFVTTFEALYSNNMALELICEFYPTKMCTFDYLPVPLSSSIMAPYILLCLGTVYCLFFVAYYMQLSQCNTDSDQVSKWGHFPNICFLNGDMSYINHRTGFCTSCEFLM